MTNNLMLMTVLGLIIGLVARQFDNAPIAWAIGLAVIVLVSYLLPDDRND